MIAAAGYAGVVVGLVSAIALVVQAIRVRMGATSSREALRWPVWSLVAGAAVAMGALELGLLTNDFSIEYVVENHARATPLIFTIASAWAALEGSIVLWGLVLAGYIGWTFRKVQAPDDLGTVALAIMGVVAVFFFGLMATAANPFQLLDVVPTDGIGPNPLLQNNILMAVHPPLLYLGFVGLTVPYAFAMSALANSQPGSVWLERTHRATLVAWTFLTAGIALGALWSYVVLGWGGYWAWDPVENASLLPWLAATAFIHSAVVQRRRGMLAAWNVALIISTFALTILGTFLTRSGVVASVHSFTQSAVGPAILAFLVVVVVGSFGLFAMRAHIVASAPRLESLTSREGVFLLNNLLLTLFAFVILIGTLYPILLEAFTGDQVSVGRPFFDRGAVPISLVLLLAMGLGPVTPYRVARTPVMWERLRTPVRLALAAGALAVLLGVRHLGAALVIVLAAFIVTAIGRHLWNLARRSSAGRDIPLHVATWRLLQGDAGYWGGQLAHIGIAVVAVAITFSSVYSERGGVALQPGESTEFGGYTLNYENAFSVDEGYRSVIGANVRVQQGTDTVAVLRPRLNTYPGQAQSVPTPAVRIGLVEDLYLSLTRIDASGISLDVFRFPFQWGLWAGGFLIVAGGAWALAMGKKADRPTEDRQLADA